jgi:hypothetical protein
MKIKYNYCLLTNDVETTSIWFNSLRDEMGLKVLKEGMPALLDIYSKYNILSTFFFTGYIARLVPEIVKMILPYGHEIGSHALSHKIEHGFDMLNLDQQIDHLSKSKKILEDISGQEIISFRSPALRVNKYTPQALIETGFKIDSSIASTRFDAFLSYGSKQKLKWLFAPRMPYPTSPQSLFRKGTGPLIEVPISSIILAYIGTTMRISPFITSTLRNILHLENSITKKPIVFDIHPNELIKEKYEHRTIDRRSNNRINYLLKDYFRSLLKVKNLGPVALQLYESQIDYFHKRNYKFCTLKQFCQIEGLIQ